jgi:hypothetical protein
MFVLAATLSLLSASASFADDLWQDIDQTALRQPSGRALPQAYRTLRLNPDALDQLLARAPQESSESPALLDQSPVVISLPLPDGGFTRFRIVESSIMEPALAAQFPQIKTYNGQGIDDPAATMRCDVSPRGFHAVAILAKGAVYIDPYAADEPRAYISFYKQNYLRKDTSWECPVPDQDQNRDAAGRSTSGLALGHGGTLRTYRLAVAATGEYTGFFGGTVEGALAAIITTINRVNAIYQRDVAVRFTLVASQARIIYTDPNTDPYTNDDGRKMQSENQANLDAVIGSNNYDIGHVFSTSRGGIGAIRSVCNGAYKARGVTGSPSPVGDPFDVDYVAHEIGHQFGAFHTFNGSAGSCNRSRDANSAYEPGSGSTIQAYAGICGGQDLQPHGDPYFHVKSLEEITTFITSGGGSTCGALSSTGNAPPVINAGAEFTIPARTPFTLTATGSDPNGHPLSFAWEQYDLGPPSPPDNDDGRRPIFRSFAPRPEASRTFPQLADILANRESYGESAPTTTRSLNFQVTARDNQAQGGAIASATTRVNVAGGGPFAVTQPNTPVVWAGGSTQTVTWDVANTNAAPINCSNVRITLSTDGGHTFPVVLAERAPNDGSHSVIVPNAATASARIKVEAAGNIFFDISNADFTITGGGGGNRVVRVGQAGGAPGGQVSVPIELVAWGDENALGFSLTFDPAILSNPQVTPGSDAPGATLNANNRQTGSGRLGIALSLPFGQKFSAGARQIVVVTFTIASSASANSTPVGFGDQPIAREISDVNARALQASYAPGAVSLTSGLEGDVAPRPNGNGSVTITDWVQIGRFVAGQDAPAGGEFQRADTAPRESRGNGSLTITDWVQAGRYAAGLDGPTPAGGPTAQGGFGFSAAARQAPSLTTAGSSQVRIRGDHFERGQQSSITIELGAEGNENALGFSLDFDPARLRFVSAAVGRDASRATLNVNASHAAQGRIGLALALPAGQTIPAGQRQILVIHFAVVAEGEAATAAIGFGDWPVRRELSDANAVPLPASFNGGAATLTRDGRESSRARLQVK